MFLVSAASSIEGLTRRIVLSIEIHGPSHRANPLTQTDIVSKPWSNA
jgi:hypothetical protein